MKNLKRLIALVAVFALALTTIASAATFTDVAEDSAYYEAVETLTKLGIVDGMPDGTYQPEKVVTRAEMAKLIATMQGLGDTAQSGSATKFSDVPASHWASGFIANATGVAINGYPDGTFGPANNVKFEEAVKMIMATLGYTVVANGNGGYPMGYVTAAIKEGVTDGVANANVGTDANRGTIAQLIYNAIDTPLVEQYTWEADGSGLYTKYDGSEGKEYRTLMSENLDVVKMKGVVLANSYMDVVDGSVAYDSEADAKVKITTTYGYGVEDNDFIDENGVITNTNGHDFLVGTSDAEDYVGKAVIYFAMQNDYDEWEIVSISEDSTYNKSVTFAISDVDDKSDAEAFYYFKDGASKSTKAALEGTVKVLYNNAYYGSDVTTLVENLAGELYSGEVTLVDTNKTTGYDLVIVEAAASAVVEEVEDGIIELKADAELYDVAVNSIDTEDDDIIIKLVKDGEEITVDEIAKGDVVSVVYAADGYYMLIDVMANVVEGTVSSRKDSTTSFGGKAYKVDGTWYDVAANVSISAAAGDAGVFYIDKYGKIAFFEKGARTGGNYAWIMATKASASDIDGMKMQVQMLTKDGVKTYEFADKFAIDNVDTYEVKTYSDGDTISAIHNTLAEVTFSGEKVKSIVTAGTTLTGDDEPIISAGTALTGKYVAEDLEFDSNVTVDEDTLVFFIEMDGAAYKKSECYVGTIADIADGDEIGAGSYYYYDEDAVNDANILVVKNLATNVSAAAGLAVIVDVVDAENADEDSIFEVTMLYNGAEVTATTTHDVWFANRTTLEIGDVVKVKVNSNNVITALDVVADAAQTAIARGDGAPVSVDVLLADDGENYVAGYATGITKTSKKITLFDANTDDDGSDDVTETYNLSKFDNIYVIDNTGRKIAIKVGTSSSYKFDEKLFAGVDGAKGLASGKSLEIDDLDIGTDVDKVLDYIIVREYGEGRDTVLEAVVIKGADYRVVTP